MYMPYYIDIFALFIYLITICDDYYDYYNEQIEQINEDYELFDVSTSKNQGINEVLYRTIEIVEEYEAQEPEEQKRIKKDSCFVYKHKEKEDPFTITRDSDGVWI